METLERSLLDVAVANWTHAGEGECGDLHLVEPTPDGMLVAVVDGVGHGAEAARVAHMAISILKRHASEPVSELIKLCHEGLRTTRGAVAALGSFHARSHTLTWTGVGNVEGKLFTQGAPSGPLTLLSASGTLGHGDGIEVHPFKISIDVGDTLILASDGVRSDFYLGLDMGQSPRELADRILSRSVMHKDDAMILVARYKGAPA